MQGSIGQIAALTIYGNDLLTGELREGFWPDSSVFTFCKSVEFAEVPSSDRTERGALDAQNPPAWIEHAKAEGVRHLRLHYRHSSKGEAEDRMMTGFVGGGGEWQIEALRERDSDCWQSAWRVQNANDPNKKIWAVTYFRTISHGPHIGGTDEALDALTNQFEAILIRIADLARRNSLDWAEKSFLTARMLLHSDSPLMKGYYSDGFNSPRLSLAAKRLLGAAQSAWVFGGMGSWNDTAVDGQDSAEYDELSKTLFDVLTRAIVAATNASTADSH
jgi:hypothetical protein